MKLKNLKSISWEEFQFDLFSIYCSANRCH